MVMVSLRDKDFEFPKGIRIKKKITIKRKRLPAVVRSLIPIFILILCSPPLQDDQIITVNDFRSRE